MTLAICIIAKDGIVIASDSKASSQITSNDTVKKIFRLNNNSAVGISGDGPLALTLLDAIVPKLIFEKGVMELSQQLRVLGKDTFNDWYSHLQPGQRPAITLLLAGYTQGGEAIMYQLNSQENFVPRKSPTGFDCIGIPFLANYMLNRLYEPEIRLNNAAELATFCIKETSTQDNRVGGPTQLAMFSNVKSYGELPRSELAKMEKNCEQYRLVQKNIFYPEDPTEGPSSSEDATPSSPK